MNERGIFASMHPFFEQGAVFGRIMANTGFLSALLRADPFSAYHFFLRHQAAKSYLEQRLREEFPEMWERGRFRTGPFLEMPAAFAREPYACLHLSDWVEDYVNASIIRNGCAAKLFPVTAPVHTLSYASHGAAFLKHLWPGVTRRDRIIATSTATEAVLDGYFAQLFEGYGLERERFAPPGVTRIPLGVDPEDFAAPDRKAGAGAEIRQRLGLGDEVLFLSFSRISYLSKMDFLPVLDAFSRAAGMGLNLQDCRLVLAGRADKGDPFPEAVTALARGRGIPFSLFVFPDEPDRPLRRALFAAADVFLSPVDNIQETFGLTLVEAGAASLPVIASDFDGYRDLIRHGESGLLIPSIGPADAGGATLLSALLLPNLYHLYMAQQCALELEPFAEALLRLGADARLRASMGAAGRARVLAHYTWDKIIARYLDLWESLAATPLTAEEEAAARAARHPSLPDYSRIFRGYYTRAADDALLRERPVRLGAKGAEFLAGRRRLVVYELMRGRIREEDLRRLLRRAEQGAAFGELADAFARAEAAQDRDALLLWALKQGWLEFGGAGSGEAGEAGGTE